MIDSSDAIAELLTLTLTVDQWVIADISTLMGNYTDNMGQPLNGPMVHGVGT